MMGMRGFSLIELVTVLVLISAIAVFVVPRLNTQGFTSFSFHEELLAAVRHAQKTATASRCEVQVSVDSTRYEVRYTGGGAPECDSTDLLSAPARGGGLRRTVPSAVNVTRGATFVFDEFGVVCDNPPDCDNPIEIEINGRRDVIVEPFTGYVHD